MPTRKTSILLLILAALVSGGCRGGARGKASEPIVHRPLPARLLQANLVAGNLEALYGTSGFVYAARRETGEVTVVDDTEAAAGMPLSDRRLVILVEGSGDTLKGFRHTARLMATSRHLWPSGSAGAVLLLPVHWSESDNVVAEHVNLTAQRRGAVALQDMVRAHQLRHGDTPGSSVSLLGFSAGTRVVQMAFGGKLDPATGTVTEGERPAAMDRVANIVFAGSSISRRDPTPFEHIRGRFINFVNRRDTHFGDRAPNVAPAGSKARVIKIVDPSTIVFRSPGFAASANGFDALPWLTAEDQFVAADSSPAARQAFRRVNVRVPDGLKAYNLVGALVKNDDLDDFVNNAHNHYIMVGRGPKGATGGAQFAQYRDVALEFVREFVTPAVVSGRLTTMTLRAKTRPVTPLERLTAPIKRPDTPLESTTPPEPVGPEATPEKTPPQKSATPAK